MEKWKFPFTDELGNSYVIWVWKGDYLNMGAGAELGIYRKMVTNDLPISQLNDYKPEHWLVDKELAMPMTMTLKHNGSEITSYVPERDDPAGQGTNKWWVTGFNPAYQNCKASELEATYTVNFAGRDNLYDSFYEAWGEDKRWSFNTKTKIATLTY